MKSNESDQPASDDQIYVKLNRAKRCAVYYFEHVYINILPHTVAEFDSEDQLDQRALNSAQCFRRCFGVETGDQAVRALVIAFRRHHNFTDKEMRQMYRIGGWKTTAEGMHLNLLPRASMYGKILVGMLTAVCVTPNILALTSFAPSNRQLLGSLVCCGMFFLGSLILDWLVLEPARLMKRVNYEALFTQDNSDQR